MKKLAFLLTILASGTFNPVQAQNLYTYPFDGTTADLATNGWISTNQSNPVGASVWSVPTAPSTAFPEGGYSGGVTSYVLVNFNSTTGVGTISNWLISPVVSVQDGDIVTFYTQTTGDGTGTVYPDNLELRMSTAGATSVVPSGGDSDVGDFTALAVEVNPTLDTAGYPFDWTQFSYVVSGVPSLTDCKFAFRYYVTDGGPSGDNSNIIAVDDFSVDRTLGTNEFFKSNISMYPNPVNDVINIDNISDIVLNSAKVTDINGRTVKEINLKGVSNTQINIGEFQSGIYFLKVNTNQGVGTTKIVKK